MERIKRIPKRARSDVRIIRLLNNWREVLRAKLTGAPLKKVQFRNGAVVSAPETVSLAFLFDEICVRTLYNPPGYEIKAGDVVIDIGANVGVFATYAATAAPDVRVFSYEPFPGNLDWLRKNIEESKLANVKVFGEAVAGRPGTSALHVDPSGWIFHSLVREESSEENDILVKCVSLDQVLDDNEIEFCDLLKIDCEGSEYEILMECRPETLGRIRRIVGEYHEGANIKGTGEGLRRFLESRSFRIDYFGALEADSGIFYATNRAS